MKRLALRLGWVLVVGALRVAPAAAQRDRDLPSADEVIKKVIEKAKRDDAKRDEAPYVYTLRNVVEDFDEHGALKERRDRVYQAVIIDGEVYNRLVQKNGKPLSTEDQKREQEREKKFSQTAADRKRKKEKRDDQIALNEELFGKYKIEILDRETVNGRPALVATFEPKGRDLPAKRRIDFLLNRMAGKLWIDDDEHEVVKARFHLTGPVSKFMGLLAVVRKFDGALEQTRLDDDIWLPSKFENSFDGRIVFKSLHQRTQVEWSDFKKVSDGGKKQGAEAR